MFGASEPRTWHVLGYFVSILEGRLHQEPLKYVGYDRIFTRCPWTTLYGGAFFRVRSQTVAPKAPPAPGTGRMTRVEELRKRALLAVVGPWRPP